MTCIVGMVDKKNKNVIIGADSGGSSDTNTFIRKDGKVFKNGEFVIGCTSSFRMIQLLRFSFIPPEINGKDIYEYLCTDFINAVRECFKNNGYLYKGQGGEESGGTFLVAYKDRLFKIEDDFQVGETTSEFNSCGSGEDLALGALFSLADTNLDVEKKLRKSLEAAEYFSSSVSSPFHFINT